METALLYINTQTVQSLSSNTMQWSLANDSWY